MNVNYVAQNPYGGSNNNSAVIGGDDNAPNLHYFGNSTNTSSHESSNDSSCFNSFQGCMPTAAATPTGYTNYVNNNSISFNNMTNNFNSINFGNNSSDNDDDFGSASCFGFFQPNNNQRTNDDGAQHSFFLNRTQVSPSPLPSSLQEFWRNPQPQQQQSQQLQPPPAPTSNSSIPLFGGGSTTTSAGGSTSSANGSTSAAIPYPDGLFSKQVQQELDRSLDSSNRRSRPSFTSGAGGSSIFNLNSPNNLLSRIFSSPSSPSTPTSSSQQHQQQASNESNTNDSTDNATTTTAHNDETTITDVDIDQVNKDLMQLSVKERNIIYDEIHGVESLVDEETPEFVASSLSKFKFHVDLLKERYAGSSTSHNTTTTTSTSTTTSAVLSSSDHGSTSDDGGVSSGSGPMYSEDDANSTADVVSSSGDVTTSKKDEEEDGIRVGIEAYNKACFLAPSMYCFENVSTMTQMSKDFYMMFLRSTKYDPQKSAVKLIKHFQFKKQLFGMEKVANDITMDDLNDDDKAALYSGYHIVLPKRDNAGRFVLFINANYASYKTWMSQLRVNWCNIMSALQTDVNSQKRGFVVILYEVGRTFNQVKNQWKKRLSGFPLWQEGIPMRQTCVHFCYNDSTVRAVISVLNKFQDRSTRVRFRDHCGGHIECQYALMSFGIPASMLAIDHDGVLKREVVDQHIDRLKAITEAKRLKYGLVSKSGTATKDIVLATDKDVLLGRGKPFQSHPGNLALAKIIQEKEDEFHAASKHQKTQMTWEILRTIQTQFGGRFLERDDNGCIDGEEGKRGVTWKVCTAEAARNKVAYGFRSRAKMHKRSIASTQAAGSTFDGGLDGTIFRNGQHDKRRKVA